MQQVHGIKDATVVYAGCESAAYCGCYDGENEFEDAKERYKAGAAKIEVAKEEVSR